MNKLSISISSEISNIVKVENFVETFTDYFALPSVLYGKISLSVSKRLIMLFYPEINANRIKW